MIKGGYVLQARKTDNTKLSHKPPHFREIFNWLYRQANYRDNHVAKRGQCFRSIRDIQEGLKWYIGYRKMMYSKSQCENALNWLRNETMITTVKTTRGMLITICNYDTYQDPLNYESNNEQTTKAATKTETPVHYKQEGINKENNKIYILSEKHSDDSALSVSKDTNSIFSFEEFWNLYDKKESKLLTEKKYSKISEKDRELIKKTLPAYINKTPDKQFRKNPLTYLNSKLWLDEPEPEKKQRVILTKDGIKFI